MPLWGTVKDVKVGVYKNHYKKSPEFSGFFILLNCPSYLYTMDISYRELQKRDVINLPDGKCLGKITDLVLKFPEGVMTGICVPGKKQN